MKDLSPRERPDFEATIREIGERIDIEVTGLYQNRREAMINFNKILEWDSSTGALNEIVSSLNKRLEKKSSLSYQFEFEGRLLLAFWASSMIFNQPSDFKFISNRIRVPSSRFDQMWLILEDKKGKPRLILLTPSE